MKRSMRVLSCVLVLLALGLGEYCRAQNGHHWALRYETASSRHHPLDIAFLDDNHAIVTVKWGVLRTSDGGNTWSPLRLVPDTGFVKQFPSIAVVDERTAWVCGDAGLLFRSTDGGATFEDRSLDSSFYFGALYFLDEKRAWLVGDSIVSCFSCKSMVHGTTDGGETWNVLATFPPLYEDGPCVYWMDVHFTDSLHGWMVGSQGGLASTTDGGHTWSSYEAAKGKEMFAVYALSRDHVFISGEESYLAESTDAGVTWIEREKLRNLMLLYDLTMGHDGTLWLGASARGTSVYRSTDAGVTWLPDTVRPLEYRTIRAVTVAPNGKVWAVTEQGEILERVDGPTPTGVAGMLPLDLDVRLYPTPLPAHTAATLRVELPAHERVTVDLLALDGRAIRILYDGVLDAGTHDVRLGTLALPSGMYFARLRTGGDLRVAKVLVAP
ncbi:MAG TPA: YCF48-related protein [Bacteroidota bacterium]|nr:YCF48-related protein [Bacteroidota bacterium]